MTGIDNGRNTARRTQSVEKTAKKRGYGYTKVEKWNERKNGNGERKKMTKCL